MLIFPEYNKEYKILPPAPAKNTFSKSPATTAKYQKALKVEISFGEERDDCSHQNEVSVIAEIEAQAKRDGINYKKVDCERIWDSSRTREGVPLPWFHTTRVGSLTLEITADKAIHFLTSIAKIEGSPVKQTHIDQARSKLEGLSTSDSPASILASSGMYSFLGSRKTEVATDRVKLTPFRVEITQSSVVRPAESAASADATL